MKEKIIKILITELDYSEYAANLTADDLLGITQKLQPTLQKWLDTRVMTDIEVSGFSIKMLMEQREFTFPSALIAIDWLLTDPSTAKSALSERFRS